MQAEIIDFVKYKNEVEEKRKFAIKATEVRALDKAAFDLGFLELVDLFMQKHYPDYYWKFEKFLEECEKN